jgi:adenylate kinase
MHNNIDTILMMGRPGSGKGTQAKLLAERLGWQHFSSGDRIKQIRDGNEPFSARVREMYDRGVLLPNWFADYLLEGTLLDLAPHIGVLLDGFGRTKDQAEHLCEITEWLGRRLVVLNLDVSEDEVVQRMLGRAKSEHRPDSDSEEKIRERLRNFDRETAPGLEYFRSKGLVKDIDGGQTPEEVAASIEQALEQ